MFTTVKVPVMDDKLSPKKRQQLDRLTGRDTTVIQRYLEIITHEEEALRREHREGTRLDKAKLDSLTLTSKVLTRKKKDGSVVTTAGRPTVKYDLKAQFGNLITTRELKECRDTAVEMWHSYKEKLAHHERIYWRIMQKAKYVDQEDQLAHVLHWWATEKQPAPPCQAKAYSPRKLPRRANVQTTAYLQERSTKLTHYWLELYFPEQRKHLWLPLNPSSYHLNQLRKTKPKTVRVVKHTNGRWYAHVTIATRSPDLPTSDKPRAIVSLDLGIDKAAVAVLLTADTPGRLTRTNTKYFTQPEKKQAINDLDNQIANLQHKKAKYPNLGKSPTNISRALQRLSSKRRELAIHYDHVLTADVVRWVQRLEHRYTVFVTLGQLKGIRYSRRKGDGGSRKHRRELHRWAFARITSMLAYKLQRVGFPDKRFIPLREAWTSRTCSRCGSHDTTRPFQALLICHTCGVQLPADENGALNIGFKLILSCDEAALDHWLPASFLARKYPGQQGSESQSLTKPLLSEVPSVRSVSVAGRKHPCTQEASLTSRPLCGDDTSSPVEPSSPDGDVEPANHKPLLSTFL